MQPRRARTMTEKTMIPSLGKRDRSSRRALESPRCRAWRRRRRRPFLDVMEIRTLLSITVDTFDDVVDSGDGFTSLREAIAQAESALSDETILVPAGTYSLSLGELGINDSYSLTIQSDGGLATIDAH